MILFVCSQGLIRSRTAEVLTLLGGLNARCCGLDDDAMAPVSQKLLLGADVIACMEQRHSRKIQSYMAAEGKTIVTLSIEDVWNPFDPMLVHWLEIGLRAKLDEDCYAQAIARGYERMRGHNINLFNPDD